MADLVNSDRGGAPVLPQASAPVRLPTRDTSDLPATLGKYEVLRRLAVGGMAEILLARSTGIEGFVKHVVIKRILPQFASEQRFVAMFIDEARLAACLHHQNIAQVYDIGEDDGEYFFAMEYVHGKDVGALLREVTSRGERLPLPEALTIASLVASGLAYAHEQKGPDGQSLGIVHRDVSPSNVIVSYEGGVKLVDFGIARATIRTTETRTGGVKGKLSYMSPEQCLGHTLDARSDIFALGIVLYELTTSQRLFRHDPDDSDYVVMNRIVKGKVPSPGDRVADYPAGLEAIVMKALALSPVDRYRSARELLGDLETFASLEQIALSSAALSRYLTRVFGHPVEPWREEAGAAEPYRRPSEWGERSSEDDAPALKAGDEPASSEDSITPAAVTSSGERRLASQNSAGRDRASPVSPGQETGSVEDAAGAGSEPGEDATRVPGEGAVGEPGEDAASPPTKQPARALPGWPARHVALAAGAALVVLVAVAGLYFLAAPWQPTGQAPAVQSSQAGQAPGASPRRDDGEPGEPQPGAGAGEPAGQLPGASGVYVEDGSPLVEPGSSPSAASKDPGNPGSLRAKKSTATPRPSQRMKELIDTHW